jgi:GNAT superfamily N-acetyltransferase
MSRTVLVPRIARLEDAPVLAELWSDVLRRADRAEQVADLELVIKAAAASPEQRFVVVEYDGQVAGGVYLRLTTLSPINLEPCVQSIQPRVFDEFRRNGVGRALMDAATTFAEENGVLHMTTAVPAQARDVNRFMARLGLAPVATMRLAPTALVRNRVSPARPTRGSARSVPRVLAVRRSQRRARGADDQVPLPGEPPPVAPE